MTRAIEFVALERAGNRSPSLQALVESPASQLMFSMIGGTPLGSMASRPNRSDKTLRDISFWFAQEVIAMYSTAKGYQVLKRARGGHPVFQNSLITSFAIHFRNVADFLYLDRGIGKSKARPSDAVAEDFVSAVVWRSSTPKLSKFLENQRSRANKMIAHLTYDRRSRETADLTWDFAKIINELAPVVADFRKLAKPSQCDPILSKIQLEKY